MPWNTGGRSCEKMERAECVRLVSFHHSQQAGRKRGSCKALFHNSEPLITSCISLQEASSMLQTTGNLLFEAQTTFCITVLLLAMDILSSRLALPHGGNFGKFETFGTCRITTLNRQKVAAVAVANRHTVALLEGGTVYSWGSNLQGQLGYGTSDSASNAVPRIVEAMKVGSGPRTAQSRKYTFSLKGSRTEPTQNKRGWVQVLPRLWRSTLADFLLNLLSEKFAETDDSDRTRHATQLTLLSSLLRGIVCLLTEQC